MAVTQDLGIVFTPSMRETWMFGKVRGVPSPEIFPIGSMNPANKRKRRSHMLLPANGEYPSPATGEKQSTSGHFLLW